MVAENSPADRPPAINSAKKTLNNAGYLLKLLH